VRPVGVRLVVDVDHIDQTAEQRRAEHRLELAVDDPRPPASIILTASRCW